ncbi:hypothetical protein TIFTF001_032451 [Ficus carica]|uniref:Uncharacterized protein n=1 Tax=Ficus carica TaxID=3494 RepID=A0AA88DWR8_FICCA|nr:hypothetical protein TIFTF001_032451 [Ficus carica]
MMDFGKSDKVESFQLITWWLPINNSMVTDQPITGWIPIGNLATVLCLAVKLLGWRFVARRKRCDERRSGDQWISSTSVESKIGFGPPSRSSPNLVKGASIMNNELSLSKVDAAPETRACCRRSRRQHRQTKPRDLTLRGMAYPAWRRSASPLLRQNGDR